MFVIKLYDDEKIAGHLPMGITSLTKYPIDWGAVFGLGLTSAITVQIDQGGLGIPAKVTVTMPVTNRNHMLIDKYKEFVNEPHSEPKRKEITGPF